MMKHRYLTPFLFPGLSHPDRCKQRKQEPIKVSKRRNFAPRPLQTTKDGCGSQWYPLTALCLLGVISLQCIIIKTPPFSFIPLSAHICLRFQEHCVSVPIFTSVLFWGKNSARYGAAQEWQTQTWWGGEGQERCQAWIKSAFCQNNAASYKRVLEHTAP